MSYIEGRWQPRIVTVHVSSFKELLNLVSSFGCEAVIVESDTSTEPYELKIEVYNDYRE